MWQKWQINIWQSAVYGHYWGKKWTTEIVPKTAHEHSLSQFPDLPATEPEATTIFLKGFLTKTSSLFNTKKIWLGETHISEFCSACRPFNQDATCTMSA